MSLQAVCCVPFLKSVKMRQVAYNYFSFEYLLFQNIVHDLPSWRGSSPNSELVSSRSGELAPSPQRDTEDREREVVHDLCKDTDANLDSLLLSNFRAYIQFAKVTWKLSDTPNTQQFSGFPGRFAVHWCPQRFHTWALTAWFCLSIVHYFHGCYLCLFLAAFLTVSWLWSLIIPFIASI